MIIGRNNRASWIHGGPSVRSRTTAIIPMKPKPSVNTSTQEPKTMRPNTDSVFDMLVYPE